MSKDVLIEFMPPGMVEISLIGVDETTQGTGYGPLGIDDLQVDRNFQTDEPLAYIAYNFQQTFFETIATLNQLTWPYRYNLPTNGLYDLSLQQLLTWVYAYHILSKQPQQLWQRAA